MPVFLEKLAAWSQPVGHNTCEQIVTSARDNTGVGTSHCRETEDRQFPSAVQRIEDPV